MADEPKPDELPEEVERTDPKKPKPEPHTPNPKPPPPPHSPPRP